MKKKLEFSGIYDYSDADSCSQNDDETSQMFLVEWDS